nr:hypothetical protein BaRGS_022497 [Batillaria attramentaria]
MNPTAASLWRLSWLVVVLVLLLSQQQPVCAKHEAKVRTSECSYTLVVNEFDVSKCPVMQADGLAQDSAYKWSRSSSSNVYAPSRSQTYRSSRLRLSRDQSEEGGGVGGGGGGGEGGKEVDVLKSQVRELEGRLLEEMVRSREINSTLARHSASLAAAEGRLAAYQANFTSVFRAMMFVQRQLQRQRKINKSLNKKLSNVLLDVVEVNNVLTRVPTSPRDGTVTTTKNFDVQSVAKVRSCPGVTDKSTMYRDCAAVFEGGHKQSGVYYVKPGTAACPVPVWCDMDTPPGGWLLFQRRQDGSVSFRHNWDEYRDGFGNVAGEHWLGNDNIFLLSNQDHYQLRVDLWDFTGNRVHAVYSTFRVAGERDKYQLTLTGYTGSAQDSLYRHNHMFFSTPDRDNDGRREAHCAAEWEAGWWFNNCWFALLNGAYHNRSDVQYRGIAWNHWKREQLRKTEMKIRPVAKLDSN